VNFQGVEIDWIGHATFKIKKDIIIYTDPFVLVPEMEKADIILITHDHHDHCSPEKISQLAKTDTAVVAPQSCLMKLKQFNLTIMKVGDKKTIKGIEIEAVPAYNIGKPYHPKDSDHIGYVFDVGIKIYHAGDTDFIPEMKEIQCDIALLPAGGTYTMNGKEAADATKIIKPKAVWPMHYGTIPGTQCDLQQFKKELLGTGILVLQ